MVIIIWLLLLLFLLFVSKYSQFGINKYCVSFLTYMVLSLGRKTLKTSADKLVRDGISTIYLLRWREREGSTWKSLKQSIHYIGKESWICWADSSGVLPQQPLKSSLIPFKVKCTSVTFRDSLKGSRGRRREEKARLTLCPGSATR